MSTDPAIEFQQAMTDAGLLCSERLIADGEIQRFHVDGDRNGSRNGWYCFYIDGVPAGAFGTWKDGGVTHTWCAKRDGTLTESERAELRRRMDATKVEHEHQRAEGAAKAQTEAQKQWAAAKPAPDDHPYLVAKGVKAHGIRVDSSGKLVIPLRDTSGIIHSLQTISPDGQKLFLKGGAVSGHYHPIGKPEDTICICEGYATGATIHSTGTAVAVAFNDGNLLPVAQAIRKKYPSIGLVIASDNDQWAEGNPGVEKAMRAARAIDAKVAIPSFTNVESRPTDFNDLAQLEGLDAVRLQLKAAEEPDAQVRAEIAEVLKRSPEEHQRKLIEDLAALGRMEYDQRRKQAANELGVRVTVLDDEVDKVRGENAPTDDKLQGTALAIEDPEPWPEPIDGDELLCAVSDVFTSYTMLPKHAEVVLSLWAMHCHVYKAFVHTPRLNITSPQKRCGKTLLIDVMGTLVPRPLKTENMSVAVFFRAVEKFAPTFLADEYDTYFHSHDELRGALNAGHRRGGQVLRCEGDSNEVRGYGVFCPVVLGGIRALPGTLHDRSIIIRLKRATKDEIRSCERFDSRRTDHEADLQRKLARWAADHFEVLGDAEPHMGELHNRLADNWRPLYAIADTVGGDWPKRAREAMKALHIADDEESVSVTLLGDVRDIFGQRHKDGAPFADRITSSDLATALTAIEGRPWAEWGRQAKPITPNAVARLLKQFHILSGTFRLGNKTAKGYKLEAFEDDFIRYLSDPPSTTVTSSQSSSHAGFNGFPTVTPVNDVTVANPLKAAAHLGCYDVTVENPPSGGNREKSTQNPPEAESGQLPDDLTEGVV